MNPKEALIDALKNDEAIKRFKEIDQIIETHPTLYKNYETLKISQQKYIRAKNQKSDYSKEESAYQTQLEAIMNHPLMSEYLDLIETINMDLKWITETIESSMNQFLGDLHDTD